MKGKGYEIIGVLDMVVHTYTPHPWRWRQEDEEFKTSLC